MSGERTVTEPVDRQSVELEAMVEKAARGIFAVEKENADRDWDCLEDDGRGEYLRDGRTALEAAGVPELLEREQRLREALDALTTRAFDGEVCIRTKNGVPMRMPAKSRRLVERALDEVSTTDNEGDADDGE